MVRAFECLYAALRGVSEESCPLLYGETQTRLGRAFLQQGDTNSACLHFADAVRAAKSAGLPPEWEWRAEAEAGLRDLGEPIAAMAAP